MISSCKHVTLNPLSHSVYVDIARESSATELSDRIGALSKTFSRQKPASHDEGGVSEAKADD